MKGDAEPKAAAFITGASSGIGEACALELTKRGHPVALGARRKGLLDKLAKQIRSNGGIAHAVQLDISDAETADTACCEASDALGPIGVLINNAGVIDPIDALADANPKQWEQCIRINLIGTWNMLRAVLPGMLEAGSGTIVNISSGAVVRPLDGWSAYCASKAGLAMLTQSINHEYGASGIRAYGFRPGMVATAMQEKIHSAKINPMAGVTFDEMHRPEEAAAAVAWLVEDRPKQWCGAVEPSISDPNFVHDAGL